MNSSSVVFAKSFAHNLAILSGISVATSQALHSVCPVIKRFSDSEVVKYKNISVERGFIYSTLRYDRVVTHSAGGTYPEEENHIFGGFEVHHESSDGTLTVY